VLIVDDIWSHGRTVTTVKAAVPSWRIETAVLHYKPGASLFRDSGPNYYAAITDRFIVYRGS
jgi:hypoxanthine phosphoribosyltransferase